MSSNWKQDLVTALEAGQQPSYEQLEAALSGALTERKALEGTVCDMAQWLSKLTVAHLNGGAALSNLMNEFIAARVQVKVAAPAPATAH
jgi:hypothetical protein